MLDHLGIPVRDLGASRDFYLTALAPLGYELLMQPADHVCGFGRSGKPDFWIRRGEPAAGGRDNGGPGVREIYHPQYYGAFVLDPDGNNVEAVCHRPGETTGQEEL